MKPKGKDLRLAILREPGCPACRAAGVAEQRSMRWFLRENYGEAPTLKALLTKPICLRHTLPMLARENAHLKRTFEFLAKSRLHQSAGIRQRPRRLVRLGQSSTRAQANPCLICEAGKVAANVAVVNLLTALELEAGRAAYLEHDGLCLPHHEQVIEQAETELAGWLEEQLRERLESFLEQFRLYDRHRDVRFQHEPKGEEQEAWRRALRFFWGDVAFALEPDGYQPPRGGAWIGEPDG